MKKVFHFQMKRCDYSLFFFFSSRRRHTRFSRDWSSDVCSSDLNAAIETATGRTLTIEGIVNGATLRGPGAFHLGGGATMANATSLAGTTITQDRSEERRVGKECRTRETTYHEQKRAYTVEARMT